MTRRQLLALTAPALASGLAACSSPPIGSGRTTAAAGVPVTGGATAAGSWFSGFSLPASCRQLIVGLAPGWQATSLTLTRFERVPGGPWQAVGSSIPTRLGPGGLAWGNGLNPVPPGQSVKREMDGKTPIGVFPVGPAYGYAADIQRHPALSYTQLQRGDLWIDEPNHPQYNQFVRTGHPPRTEFEREEEMRFDDHAHSLKLFIGHNSGPRRRAGAGSAIFFHIWRDGGGRATAGCTAMPEVELKRLIAWIDPGKNPLYVLLPRDEYQRLRRPWGLP